MSTDSPVLYPVATVGAWRQSGNLVSEIACWPDLWSDGCRDPEWSREDLTAAIAWSGGITDKHALEATTHRDGSITLDNGVHRRAVADELGYLAVPVVMTFEPAEAEVVPGAEFAY